MQRMAYATFARPDRLETMRWIKVAHLLMFVFSFCSMAQKPVRLHIDFSNAHPESFAALKKQDSFQNIFEIENFLKNLLYDAHKKGFAGACFDSLTISDTLVKTSFISGEKIFLAELNLQQIEPDALRKLRIDKNMQQQKVFNANEIFNLMNNIVSYYENNGYPFAVARLENMIYRNDTVWAEIACRKGTLITIDTIINTGNIDIMPSVLFSFIGIFPGDIYNQSALNNISFSLKQIPFIRETDVPKVGFNENGAVIMISANRRPVNTFDGIIGFMSDAKNEGKLSLTGSLTLSLSNSLQTGEKLMLKWKQPEPLSQDLKTHAEFPWLIYIPLGIAWDFRLLKKDTSFVNADNKFFLFFSKQNITKIGGYVQFFNSSAIRTNNPQAQPAPPLNDMKTSSLGVKFIHAKTDNLFNPQKGKIIHIDISAGKRVLLNFSPPDSISNNIQPTSTVYKGETDLMFFIPLFENTTVLLRNLSGGIFAPNLFDNELFRIGGINNLRGFDEERFFVSMYSIQTLEYRYIFGEFSRFVLFVDFGYLEKISMTSRIFERPVGTGTGITLNTSAGQFSLFYALGTTSKEPFNLRNSRIHFGYLVQF